MEYISHSDYTKMLSNFGKETPKGVLKEAIEKEGNAFTAALAKTPKGGKFKVDGKTMKDTSNYDDPSVKEATINDEYPESWKMREDKEMEEGLNMPSQDMQATGPTIQSVEETGHNAAYNFSVLSQTEREQLAEFIKSVKTIKQEIGKLLEKAKGGVKMEGGNTTEKMLKVGKDAQEGPRMSDAEAEAMVAKQEKEEELKKKHDASIH
jgi:hypothetical protein